VDEDYCNTLNLGILKRANELQKSAKRHPKAGKKALKVKKSKQKRMEKVTKKLW